MIPAYVLDLLKSNAGLPERFLSIPIHLLRPYILLSQPKSLRVLKRGNSGIPKDFVEDEILRIDDNILYGRATPKKSAVFLHMTGPLATPPDSC
jgi:hypothetical protein